MPAHSGPPPGPALAPIHEPVPRFQAGDWLVRVVVPAYIALGATAKLFTGTPAELPRLLIDYTSGDLWKLFLVVVASEYILAAVIAMHPRLARLLAQLALGIFTVVALSQVANRDATCGCFGTLPVSPELVLVADVVLLVLTAALPRRALPPEPGWGRWGAMTAVGALAIVFTFGAERLNLVGRLGDPARTLDVDLLRARGKAWDDLVLAKVLPVNPADFPESVQTYVLYRQTCPSCHNLFRLRFADPTAERVIAILVPPDPGAAAEPPGEDIACPSCVRTSLPADRAWRVRTPLVIRVENGRVAVVERVQSMN